MKTKKISLPIIIVSIVAFMMIATGIASWIITISKDFSLEYSKEGEIVSGLDCSSVVYDGNGHLPLLKDDAGVNFKDPDVFSKYKFEFRKKGEFKWNPVIFDTAYVPSEALGSSPTDAGDYEIRYTDPSNFSCIVDFTIDKATPTVNNVATLGTTTYGNLPVITQPTSTPATYVLFDGATDNVTGSFTFLDEESTKFNSTVRNYTGEATTTSASTKLLFVPTSSNYNSVEVDATFTAEAVAYCSTTYYCSIEKALEANTSSGTIFVIPGKNPGVYESCTVASGVTLSLPYEGENTLSDISGSYAFARNDAAKYKKSEVSIASGVKLTVNGSLIIGGIITGGGGTFVSGHTAQNYSQITLGQNSIIEANGSIECYGYIIGVYGDNESKVNIKSTGSILMPFIVHEHRGGSLFLDMAGGYTALLSPDFQTFPFNRFNFNNVEAALIIEYGGRLLGRANLFAGSQNNITTINVIGPSSGTTSLLALTSGAYVEARYVHDTQIIDLDVYGGGTLNVLSMSLKASGMTVNLSTKGLLFPISWYYNISLNKLPTQTSATYSTTAQDLKLLPGAVLTINEGVIVTSNTISIYSDIPVDGSGCPSYPTQYPTGSIMNQDIPSGRIILNGTLNVSNLGGLVLTNVEGAKLNVTSSAVVSSKELITATPSYADKKEYLKVHLFRSTGISESASVVATGNYESKADSKGKCGWLVDPINLSYDINLGAGAIVYKENITIKNSSGAVIGYQLTSSDLPSSVISNPVRENYQFIGWSLDPTIDPDDWTSPVGEIVYANTVFYAIWKPVEYGIIYDVDNYYDGTTLNSNHGSLSLETTFENGYYQTYNVEGTYSIPTPVISGFKFGGWYTDAECTNRIVNIIPGTFTGGVVTIYALWNPAETKEYTVEFEVVLPDGQIVPGDTIGLNTITQSCFSKDGVDFNLQPYINILANSNNDSSKEIYYTNITNSGTMINESSIRITDDNTINSKLLLTIVAYKKMKITYSGGESFYVISNTTSSNTLPSGTSYAFTVINPTNIETGYRMVWFTSSTKDNATYFIGGQTYSSGINESISNFDDENNELILYGEQYYFVNSDNKASCFTNGIFNKGAANVLLYHVDLSGLKTTASISVFADKWGSHEITSVDSVSAFTGLEKLIIEGCTNSGATLGNTYEDVDTAWFGRVKAYARAYCGVFNNNASLKQVIFGGDSSSVTTSAAALGVYSFSNITIKNVKFIATAANTIYNGSASDSTTVSGSTIAVTSSNIPITAKP